MALASIYDASLTTNCHEGDIHWQCIILSSVEKVGLIDLKGYITSNKSSDKNSPRKSRVRSLRNYVYLYITDLKEHRSISCKTTRQDFYPQFLGPLKLADISVPGEGTKLTIQVHTCLPDNKIQVCVKPFKWEVNRQVHGNSLVINQYSGTISKVGLGVTGPDLLRNRQALFFFPLPLLLLPSRGVGNMRRVWIETWARHCAYSFIVERWPSNPSYFRLSSFSLIWSLT